MATTTATSPEIGDVGERERVRRQRPSMIARLLMPVASLRLTVVLMALSVFIVLAGTLAQAEVGTETAVDDYFRVRPWGSTLGFAWIPFQILFPEAFFPNPVFDTRPAIGGGFWFPGGWLIGLLMFVNLLAAHAVRFTIQAKGKRLLLGLATILAGAGLTAAVVMSGSGADGLQANPMVGWDSLWLLFQVQVIGIALANIGLSVWLWRKATSDRRYFWVSVMALPITLGLSLWVLFAPQVGDSSMRILWQLIKATMAALVLLAGCWLVFRKRSGVVLLHSGVAMLMISELMVGLLAVETRMTLAEGETTSWAFNLNRIELAVIDPSDPKADLLTRFPGESIRKGETLKHESVPFSIRIDEYFKNAGVVRGTGEAEKTIDSGLAKGFIAQPKAEATGASSGQTVDQPAAYVTLFDKQGKRMGSYLASVAMSSNEFVETIPVDGKDWRMALRFRRDYKPYQVTLIDVKKEDYVGTDTPRSYSSDVRVVSDSLGADFTRKIWMNNPLRFAGETLYQSGYHPMSDGTEMTTLQIVRNTGWMLPYVACMIVVVGMGAQFLITLSRFVSRRAEMGEARPETIAEKDTPGPVKPARDAAYWKGWIVPAVIVLACAGALIWRFTPQSVPPSGFDIAAFGKLPIASHGRVKPVDTVARDALKALSNNRQQFKMEETEGSSGRAQRGTATQWLIELIATPQKGAERRVIRIENDELLAVLQMPSDIRRGTDSEPVRGVARADFTYTIAEVVEASPALAKRMAEIHDKTAAKQQLTPGDRAALDLNRKIQVVSLLMAAFRVDLEPFYQNPLGFLREYPEQYQILKHGDPATQRSSMNPPLAVWYTDTMLKEDDRDRAEWETLGHAELVEFLKTQMAQVQGESAHQQDPAVKGWNDILKGWADQDATAFNASVSRYAKLVAEQGPEGYDKGKVDFEAYFNHAAPFYYLLFPYVLAALLASASWMGFSRTLNRAALGLILFCFVVHTLVLLGRIYISGRPPVTNLYSSSIFIGWAAVAFGIVLELFFRLGFGSVLAGGMGFGSLLIAHNLSGDGSDTYAVLQAVLDTQFWLATHVVTVTLGYAATFVAGFLGVIYILIGFTTRKLGNHWGEGHRRQTMGQTLVRMMYGVMCFALLFSFFGTVLGGLWADDSWGRFWGWDPKENGALMIVMWTALVLHARWGGMVKDRGLAVLSVLGNIVVSWSWFGTNELGVGLHSYGFTEGVLLALGLFVLSQLTIALAGCLPKSWWVSFRNQPAMTEA